MLYIRCPTCKSLLGDKQVYYETKLKEICRKNELGHYKTIEEFNDAKTQIVDKLIVDKNRYCCKMRLITFVSLVNTIV